MFRRCPPNPMRIYLLQITYNTWTKITNQVTTQIDDFLKISQMGVELGSVPFFIHFKRLAVTIINIEQKNHTCLKYLFILFQQVFLVIATIENISVTFMNITIDLLSRFMRCSLVTDIRVLVIGFRCTVWVRNPKNTRYQLFRQKTVICEIFNCLPQTIHEIQCDDGQTDERTFESQSQGPVSPFGYGTLTTHDINCSVRKLSSITDF